MKARVLSRSILFIRLSLLLTLLLGVAQSTVAQSRSMVLAGPASKSKNLSKAEVPSYGWARAEFSTPAAAVGAGYALQFDGVDDFVSIADSGDFDFDETFTVEVWAKPSSLSGSDGYKAFLSGSSAEPPSVGGAWKFFLSSSNYSSWGLAVCVPGCSSAQSGSGSLQVNQWQHLAATYDGSDIRIYKDGALVDTRAHSGNVSNVQFVLVGIWETSFDGLIDEVRVWNITRTQTEIQDNKDHSLNGDESGLVGYWEFDEGTGQVVNDSTSNNNDGRLGELPASDDKDPVWVVSDAPINAPTDHIFLALVLRSN